MKKIIVQLFIIGFMLLGSASAEEGTMSPGYFNPDPYECSTRFNRLLPVSEALGLNYNDATSYLSCRFKYSDLPMLKSKVSLYRRQGRVELSSLVNMVVAKVMTRQVYENYFLKFGQ